MRERPPYAEREPWLNSLKCTSCNLALDNIPQRYCATFRLKMLGRC